MKKCFKCLQEKPLAAFYAHRAMADGHLNKCKACTKKDVSEHRAANLERIRAYDTARSQLPHRKEHARKTFDAAKARNPNRVHAARMLANAVKRGDVQKWPVCAVPTCSGKPEGHHWDYDRPLDVVWLCRSHHLQAHAISRMTNDEMEPGYEVDAAGTFLG